jgi:hypothetical protein
VHCIGVCSIGFYWCIVLVCVLLVHCVLLASIGALCVLLVHGVLLASIGALCSIVICIDAEKYFLIH